MKIELRNQILDNDPNIIERLQNNHRIDKNDHMAVKQTVAFEIDCNGSEYLLELVGIKVRKWCESYATEPWALYNSTTFTHLPNR